jgi:hypothetical protein
MNRPAIVAVLLCLGVSSVGVAWHSDATQDAEIPVPPAPPASAPATTQPQQPPLAPEREAELQSTIDGYNNTYDKRTGYNTEVNAYLLRCLDRIGEIAREDARRTGQPEPPLSPPVPLALDIAMGDGRNTLALAQKGYEAHGFDISDVGVDYAIKRAAQLDLKVHVVVADAYAFDYGHERWDLVTMMYFGMPEEQMRRIKDSVKRGGYIIIERNGQEGRGFIHDEQRNPRNQLLKSFLDWDVIDYEHGLLERDWGVRRTSTSKGTVLRLLARKPPVD